MCRVCVYRLSPTAVLSALMALCPLTLGAVLAQEQPTAPARALPRPDQLEPAVDTTKSAPAATRKPAAVGTVAAPKEPSGAKAGARKGADRLELDPTDITGNRELPKVLYIVPWKRSDLGDLVGKPVNSLLDDVLQPLDRDVFRRENRYYDALKPEPAVPEAGAVQGSGDKP